MTSRHERVVYSVPRNLVFRLISPLRGTNTPFQMLPVQGTRWSLLHGPSHREMILDSSCLLSSRARTRQLCGFEDKLRQKPEQEPPEVPSIVGRYDQSPMI